MHSVLFHEVIHLKDDRLGIYKSIIISNNELSSTLKKFVITVINQVPLKSMKYYLELQLKYDYLKVRTKEELEDLLIHIQKTQSK